jgi:hypothetical protein
VQAAEAIAKEHAARRFEADEDAVVATPVASATVGGPAVSRPAAKPRPTPRREEPEDAMARLMKAKKRALEDREKKDKDKQ